MMIFTERLPISTIPKERIVPLVGDDMINNYRYNNLIFLKAFHTEWMLIQISPAGFLPSGIITTVIRRRPIFINPAVIPRQMSWAITFIIIS
jgi:hypothetical protein